MRTAVYDTREGVGPLSKCPYTMCTLRRVLFGPSQAPEGYTVLPLLSPKLAGPVATAAARVVGIIETDLGLSHTAGRILYCVWGSQYRWRLESNVLLAVEHKDGITVREATLRLWARSRSKFAALVVASFVISWVRWHTVTLKR